MSAAVSLGVLQQACADRAARGPAVRVLHVLASPGGGGMERSLLRLIQATSRSRSADVGPRLEHGICVLQDAHPELLDEFRSLARVWALRAAPAGGLPGWLCWYGLRRVIRRYRPDLVHARATSGWFDTVLALQGLRGRPKLMLSFHGKETPGRPGLRRRLLNRWSAGRADCVMAVSNEAADMLIGEGRIPRGKVVTLHNGVDLDLFRPGSPPERDERRQRMGLSGSHRVVVCIANLMPIKALDVLLRAWQIVQAADPQARLLLAGDGPMKSSLQRLAGELGCSRSTRFLEACSDVAGLLRAADLSVLPSRYEACSNAILESMASGVPVVACDVGGNPELIEPGRTGWLVRPDSECDLAVCIQRALIDDAGRRQIALAARRLAEASFGLGAWVQAYAGLYQSVATGSDERLQRVEHAACAE